MHRAWLTIGLDERENEGTNVHERVWINRARGLTKAEKVARALRDSMPGLVNPEAWPWMTMARAALAALDITEDMPKGPAGDHGQVGWMGGEFDR